jgi:HEPN domain-containing protein
MLKRSDFQNLARQRIADAEVLLKNRCYAGAYYLAGYAVECGLKACIARQTRRYDFPPAEKVVRDIYTHDLDKLVKSAGLRLPLDGELQNDPQLEVNWSLAKDWSEGGRYRQYSEREARSLLEAITNPNHGVLKWISQHW